MASSGADLSFFLRTLSLAEQELVKKKKIRGRMSEAVLSN